MSTQNRTHSDSWHDNPFHRLAARSAVPGCRRPTITQALAEIASR